MKQWSSRRSAIALAIVLLIVNALVAGCTEGSAARPTATTPGIAAVGTPTATGGTTPTPLVSTPTATPIPSSPTPPPTVNPSPTQPPASGPLPRITVHFIDVGQGDAILVDLGTIEILIDGGDNGKGPVDYLKKNVDGPLEVLVGTHPDADHIGGLDEVLAALDVQHVWLSGDTKDTKTYKDAATAVGGEGAETHAARRGDRIRLGDLELDVLHPIEPLDDEPNNNSVVLSLRYGRFVFLFVGDAEAPAEASMLAAKLVPDVDFLKVGHHGSRTASSAPFLAAAKPEVAIYSAGVGNRYDHPHQEALSALAAAGAQVYGTDTRGTIRVLTDGESYEVLTSR